jgi:hypothetical protein
VEAGKAKSGGKTEAADGETEDSLKAE